MEEEQQTLNISDPVPLSEQLREMGFAITDEMASQMDVKYLELFERHNFSKAKNMLFKEPEEYPFEDYAKDIEELINSFDF